MRVCPLDDPVEQAVVGLVVIRQSILGLSDVVRVRVDLTLLVVREAVVGRELRA